MKDKFKKVLEFNKAFGLVTNEEPTLSEFKETYLRYNLMEEELSEYKEGLSIGFHTDKDKGLNEVLDALVDMQYVLDGMIVHHGLQHVFEESYNEVHASNMSKLEDGKAIYREDGKVLKGKDYFKPNLEKILNK